MIKKIILLSIISISFAAMHGMEDEKYPLHEAVEKGDIDEVRELLEQSIDINTLMHGKTALHIAATNQHIEMAELLLENGANVNAKDKKFGNRTPLHIAIGLIGGGFIQPKNTQKCIEMVSLFAKNGADMNARCGYNEVTILHGLTHFSKHEYTWPIKPIYKDEDKDEELDMENMENINLLLKSNEEFKCLNLLLKTAILHGADINVKNKNGNGPLQEAIIMRNECMVYQIIMNGADLWQKNLKKKNALEILEDSIDKRKKDGLSCLTEKNQGIRSLLKIKMSLAKKAMDK